MPDHARPSTAASHLVARLAQPRRMTDQGPIAARFVHSLRLIALYDRAGHDPVPELANRLGSVAVAAKSLILAQTVAAIWPETIHLARFCCPLLTHDEATIGALINHACACDRSGFEAQIEGLIRPERAHRLWEGVLALIDAELRAV
jgi:hypothetical protein